MRALALVLLAALLCGTTAQVVAPKKKAVLFCVLPDEYRILALQCMWRQTNRKVQQLISNIMMERQWGVKHLARGLCSPYEVFALNKHFKTKGNRKLLGEAVAHTEACIRYIITHYLDRATAQQ